MAAAVVTGKRKRTDAHPKTVQFKKAATELSPVNHVPSPTRDLTPAVEAEREETARKPLVDVALDEDVHIQIILGSYERVLHGISASIPRSALSQKSSQDEDGESEANSKTDVLFSDTFLFAAHASSIRCLALSPPTDSSKRMLATGSSDERINLYSISTSRPTSKTPRALSLAGTTTSENSRNRSLGNLIHHDRAITGLHFPSKAKLFSAAEDNTLAISRTRDWTMLSSIRAPIPKPQGRPSGDTAAPGEVPAGVNDFAVHPSQRLMLSVGRGERCMRLWNLMTGKKAGVLSFEREVLAQVGEGRHATGEGRKVLWDAAGEAFVIGFERGAVVFGVDSKPRAIIKPDRPTKLHQMRFLPNQDGLGDKVLAVSTEDGRVLFFDLAAVPDERETAELPTCACLGQLGGAAAGLGGRIKDFEVVQARVSAPGEKAPLVLVTGSSDGALRLWTVFASDFQASRTAEDAIGAAKSPRQMGKLIGTLETSNRITCLGAFVLDGKAEDETDVASHGAAENGSAESESDIEDSD